MLYNIFKLRNRDRLTREKYKLNLEIQNPIKPLLEKDPRRDAVEKYGMPHPAI